MEIVIGVLILIGVFLWLVLHFSRGIGTPPRPEGDVPAGNRAIAQAEEEVRLARQEAQLAEQQARVSLLTWKVEQEAAIRQDAIARSKAVTLGKVSEHLAPFMGSFPFCPKDARFVGSPIDFVVFDGLDAGYVERVVFVEIKTGGSAALSPRERAIRDAIKAGRVEWQGLRILPQAW